MQTTDNKVAVFVVSARELLPKHVESLMSIDVGSLWEKV